MTAPQVWCTITAGGPAGFGTSGMMRVGLEHHPLTASAALVWNGDLPRPLQQMLFEVADNLTQPASPRPGEAVSPAIPLAATA
jgi:hypothetical protein